MRVLETEIPRPEMPGETLALPPQPKLPGFVTTTKPDLDNFVNRNMPFWTTQDTRNAILATLIPGGAAAIGLTSFMRDAETMKWWEVIRKPSWAPKDVRFYATMDLLTMSPLGYASYLVYKNGGGFDYNDTRLALGLYGANLVIALATIPYIKKRRLTCIANNTVLIHITAAAAVYTFYKIDRRAGLLMVPYSLWTGFYALLTWAIKKENDPVKNI
ncbi:unnamed protein product, partial [Mesorhabditis belari]|uniref:Uncharacterized protein n=1 Tax=Mesorhabditis belari TaxID=2138241 RepID=A0AAF3J787_9BILA